jgi:phage virion morphogenesis protein
MSVSIKADYRDFGRMGGKVMNFLATLSDTRPLLEDIGDVLLLNIDRRFEEGRGPDGTPWQKTNRGGQILVHSARYRNSFDKRVEAQSVAAGTNAIYARIHQFGGTIKPKRAKVLAFTIGGKAVFAKQVTIPARPVLGLGAEDIKGIRGAIADFVRTAHREAHP